MRGIEASVRLWKGVQKGEFVSEALRRVGSSMAPGERTLAASLLYALVRRLSLWDAFMTRFLLPKPSKFSPPVRDAVLIGSAGLMELRTFAPAALIAGLVESTKKRDPRGARVVNAVLRRVLEEGPAFMAQLEADDSLELLALRNGVPFWVACRWSQGFGDEEARRLIALQSGESSLALRLSPGSDGQFWADCLRKEGYTVELSPLCDALRLQGSALPTSLPGYEEGALTPQSESSMLVGLEASKLISRGFLLDFCAGRGVKTCQMAQLNPDLLLEGWDLSSSRIKVAERESQRLALAHRMTMKSGDSLVLEPSQRPDAILVDAPCSGSGTWRRHPEARWRLRESSLDELASLQKALLSRACDLVVPGGAVLYSTCSFLDEENDQVVAAVCKEKPMVLQKMKTPWPGARTGSCGTLLWPETPWSDGFYLSILRRQS